MPFVRSNRRGNFWGIDLLEPAAHHRVLEIGFGPGVAIERLAERVTDGEIVGIDHSEAMLDQASRRNRAAIAEGRVRLLLGSADALPVDLGHFDRIVSANLVMFWDDPLGVYRKLLSLLVPGGVIATSYQPRQAGATPDDAAAMAQCIEGWMRTAGFTDIRS